MVRGWVLIDRTYHDRQLLPHRGEFRRKKREQRGSESSINSGNMMWKKISRNRTIRHGDPNQNRLSGDSSTPLSRWKVSRSVCLRSSIYRHISLIFATTPSHH